MIAARAVVAEAERRAGIDDGDAAALHPHLELLAASLNATGGLSEAGAASVVENLVARTADRLEGQRWLRDHPEIAAERIERPVFLTGLPRSGTTFFQYLFDRDDRFRLIRTWEAIAPNPPPGADPTSVERRKAEEQARRAATRPQIAGFEAMHLVDRDGPDECHAFLEQSYAAAGLFNLFDVPGFFAALGGEVDLTAAYRVHARQLQLLQWRRPRKRWALKYPAHMLAFNAIRTVHPEARFVVTHRDPVQTLASLCKLTAALRGTRSATPPDRNRIGAQLFGFVRKHIDAVLAFAAGPDADRAVHVDYYRLLDDPAAAIAQVHAGLGIDTPETVRAAVAEWSARNPKGTRGANPYALADYGLDERAAADAYRDYIKAFAIPREAEGLARRTVA